MLLVSKLGVNWVNNIPNYTRVLNKFAREELGRYNPFEIYYGHISNFVSRFNLGPNSSIYQDVNFTEDLTIQKILHRSEHCGKHIDERLIAKYKKYKFVELEKDEMVLVRLRSKG